MNGIIECTLIIIIFVATIVDPLKPIAGIGKSVNWYRNEETQNCIKVALSGDLVDLHSLGLSP